MDERRLGGRAGDDPGQPAGTGPPEGFSLAREFAGLQGDKASVLVVEITSGADLTGLPFRARIYRGRQAAQGVELDKWLMLADGGSTLTLVNVSAVKAPRR